MRFAEVTRVQQRLEMLEAVSRYGLTVSETCRVYGVSRDTFYYWRRRYDAGGLDALADRSTVPLRSPGQIPQWVELLIVEHRRNHPRWGARRIRAELARAKVTIVPSRTTVHRVLQRNELIGPPRPKQPAPQRFERARVNELWQIDAKDWTLRDATPVEIVSVLDDRSRFCAQLRAFTVMTAQHAIEVFDLAASEHGMPQSVLSDRGSEFTGRTYGSVGPFERHLWGRDVFTINGRGAHPQTQGKVERFHRTLGEALDDAGPVDTLNALNETLATFRHHYNTERPHQSLGDATPAEIFASIAKAGPDPTLAEQRCRRETIRSTRPEGTVAYGTWIIGLGRAWANTKVRIIDTGNRIEILSIDDHTIRVLEPPPDPDHRYIGTGTPRRRQPTV